jgi:DNA repair protein RecO (recombination protein O)
MLTKDTAICIRTTDFSETSQIVTLFTRATGKISTIAKGSKRPKSAFDGPIEMFSHGEIVFSDSAKEKLAVLTEFEQQPGFVHLSNNLFDFNCCLFAVELLNNLTDDYDPHPELFDSFFQFLHDVNERQATSDERPATIALLILFQLSLLKEVGLQPVLSYCVNCKTRYERPLLAQGQASDKRQAASDELYFSSSANGLICRDCEAAFADRIKLSASAAKCLSSLKHIADADQKTLNEIEKILVFHFTETLGRQPKMAKYILKN